MRKVAGRTFGLIGRKGGGKELSIKNPPPLEDEGLKGGGNLL